MYSFAQRSDMSVIDEPVFGHFLKNTGVLRPSREEVLTSMPLVREKIMEQWDNVASPHLFLKHMANHLVGWAPVDVQDHVHVILTRHPAAVLVSYTEHIAMPTMLDLCYEHQMNWLEQCERLGGEVVVIDSDRLLANPTGQLQQLCSKMGLPWEPAMMYWDAGGRPEDGVWAKYWYHRVRQSSGWEAREAPALDFSSRDIPRHLSALYEETLPMYKALKKRALL